MPVAVRAMQRAGGDAALALSADDQRNVRLGDAQRIQRVGQALALGAAGAVVQDGFVGDVRGIHQAVHGWPHCPGMTGGT
ncbi:Uncharacterised protein [Bordetella pertussis]|nr:Uncharacterised protein [Bordetella pertussis]